MAVFNVAFLNPKMRKKTGGGSGVSILGHQLSILENELGKDGYLAPGDYDLLIKRAREIQSSGALTPTQRSSYDVKISGYKMEKEVSVSSRKSNIEEMNRDMEVSDIEINMMEGNNPSGNLKAKIISTEDKIQKLFESIQKRELTGMDTTEHLNEYYDTMSAYTSLTQTLNSLNEFDGENPIGGHVAYVKTNSHGEIVNVDYSPYGSKSGYVETDGMIDGLQIYGKVNQKREGKNYFMLGSVIFSAVDVMEADAENPGQFKPTKLESNARTRGPYKIGTQGYLNIDSKSLQVQSYVPRNSWAKGVSGNLYKRGGDGNYTKYLNLNQSIADMPKDIEDIMTIHPRIESSIKVNETVDFAEPIAPLHEELKPSWSPGEDSLESQAQMSMPRTAEGISRATPSAPARRSSAARTRKPTERASSGLMATAQRTVQSGVDYLKSKFS